MTFTIHTYYGDFFWPLLVLGYIFVSLIVVAIYGYIIGCRTVVFDKKYADREWGDYRRSSALGDWEMAQHVVSLMWPIGVPITLAVAVMVLIKHLCKQWEKGLAIIVTVIIFPFIFVNSAALRAGKRFGCGDRK